MRRIDLALIENHGANHAGLASVAAGKSQPSSGIRMSPALAHILEEVQREIGASAGVDHEELPGQSELTALTCRVAERCGLDLTAYECDQILGYIETTQKPFGALQELVDDKQITDIIVTDYSKVTVQHGRRNLATDFSFPSQEAFEVYVERLLKRAGSTYSTKKPIADGMIGSFARVHVVHKSLCESGPYLTIRINRFSEVAIQDLVDAGMAPQGVFDYLRAMVRSGQTILVVGEVGVGKTTMVRGLAAAIPMDESILVIEDTPEIKLDHPHVRYLRTREANSDGAGRISPSECIRGGMRMAMNRIIFGEMRDAEAAEAFIDVCASGHPGLSTIHGKSAAEAITRLELFLGRAQKGVANSVLSQQVATAVQAIVSLDVCRMTGRRRVMEVREIGPVADGILRQKEIFRYEPRNGGPAWLLRHRVSSHRDLIEGLEQPVLLSSYPSVLELEMDALYKEAAYRRSA